MIQLRRFCENLRHIISKNGTIDAFADKIGMSSSGVKKWLAGNSVPNLRNLISINEHYNVSIDWLVDLPVETRGKNETLNEETLCLCIELLCNHLDKEKITLKPKQYASIITLLYNSTNKNKLSPAEINYHIKKICSLLAEG